MILWTFALFILNTSTHCSRFWNLQRYWIHYHTCNCLL